MGLGGKMLPPVMDVTCGCLQGSVTDENSRARLTVYTYSYCTWPVTVDVRVYLYTCTLSSLEPDLCWYSMTRVALYIHTIIIVIFCMFIVLSVK